MHGCMHRCMDACMNACMDACMNAWMHDDACMDACMEACMDAWIDACVDAWMHACSIHLSMHASMHQCMYAWLHAWMHVWIHPGLQRVNIRNKVVNIREKSSTNVTIRQCLQIIFKLHITNLSQFTKRSQNWWLSLMHSSILWTNKLLVVEERCWESSRRPFSVNKPNALLATMFEM